MRKNGRTIDSLLAAEVVTAGGDAYPGSTWERLAGIKARYDPDNLFRLNQNIPTATLGS